MGCLATAGDAHFGGQDFDNCLLAYCIQDFKNKTGLDMSNCLRSKRRLKTECEQAKRILSDNIRVSIEIGNFFEGRNFELSLTRNQFEDICKNYFEKCMDPVNQVLK